MKRHTTQQNDTNPNTRSEMNVEIMWRIKRKNALIPHRNQGWKIFFVKTEKKTIYQ